MNMLFGVTRRSYVPSKAKRKITKKNESWKNIIIDLVSVYPTRA